MNTIIAKTNETPIVITRGIYDLLKIFVNKKKLSRHNEIKLDQELKYAVQVLRKDVPENIVDLGKTVKVKETTSGAEYEYNLVSPQKARRKHNTISILSPIGIALLGYPQGAVLSWEMPDGVKEYQILEVKSIA
ncbi:GreA/GreB family elongation factor [Pedobacter sp. UBA4863]|uniref:GreA/GreB family elongation factor n=1 Tax=Pedobacter sp. UBA4863 TaxID=1947060 RepID=UPI0025D4FFF5|nr:GreA/GreB family elongation factor [Pedobacter sp. UBA4863]